MSRFDGKLTGTEEASLDAAELLAALRGRKGPKAKERHDAIACYLSASEGWRDASRVLGGAFAGPDDAADGEGLSGEKDA